MEQLARSDLFFLTTTVAILGIALILGVVLLYAIFILRDIRQIVRTTRVETEAIAGDIERARAQVASAGILASIMGGIQRFRQRSKRR